MSQNYLEELFGSRDRVAVITGGGTGLGFWMAEAWVKAGGRVWISGRREDVLQDACAKLNALAPHSANSCAPSRASPCAHAHAPSAAADLSTRAGIAALHTAVAARETAVDALVNNAGTIALDAFTAPTQSAAEMGAALAKYDCAAWADTLVLSNWTAGVLTGTFLPLLAAAAARGGGRGSVLNVASTAATVWNPYWPDQAYQTSKAALLALTHIQTACASTRSSRACVRAP